VERIPATPPVIPPVSDDLARPLWSVMIPVYNCSTYIPEVLESVLQQALPADQMQIEVIDDFSTDANVEEIVKKIGKGRVSYYRQPQNVGSLRNFETCIKRSRGHYIHLLHGDDRVKYGFYEKIAELFEKFPEAGAAFSAYNNIKEDGAAFGPCAVEADKAGILDNWLRRLAEKPRLQYVCMVVKRQVYEKLGTFYIAHYGEDWEMWVRIAKHFPVAHTPQTLAEYRLHSNSITGQSFLSGQNLRDMNKIIDKISAHLPEKEQQVYNRKAKKYYAHYALRMALSLWFKTRNKKAVDIQMTEALNMHRDFSTIIKAKRYKILMLLPQAWLSVLNKMNQKYSALNTKKQLIFK
jgi:glycosyltransferase involved in cell wall biosynthesis